MKDIIAQIACNMVEEILKTIEESVKASNIGYTGSVTRVRLSLSGEGWRVSKQSEKILPDLDCSACDIIVLASVRTDLSSQTFVHF